MPGGVLALDLGAHTGWAHATSSALEVWPDPIPGRTGPFDGVTYGGKHFDQPVHVPFRRWLDKMVADLEPRAVCWERMGAAQTFKSHAAARDMLQLVGAAEGVCLERGVRYFDEYPATIKKHFTGSGRAKKADMTARCRQRGWTPGRHDVADALGLLDLAAWHLVMKNRGNKTC